MGCRRPCFQYTIRYRSWCRCSAGMATDGETHNRWRETRRASTTRRISDTPRANIVHCACCCRGLVPSRLGDEVAARCRRSGVPSPCATDTGRHSLCKLSAALLALQFLILSLYYTRLITPEQNLHLSAPFRTCSGRYRKALEAYRRSRTVPMKSMPFQ